MNVQEHETFCEPGLENIRNSEMCWDDVTWRTVWRKHSRNLVTMKWCSGRLSTICLHLLTLRLLSTPDGQQTQPAHTHTHTDHFILQICDITSRQRLNDVVELHVLTEDVLHGAVHSEGEQRFRKFSEERLQDHSGNVDVSVLIEVHRFTCTRSNETNLYWHADINTNTVRRFKKVISHVLLSSLHH